MATIRQTFGNTMDATLNSGVQSILNANTLSDLDADHDLWVKVFHNIDTTALVMSVTRNISERLKDEIHQSCENAITVLDRRYEMRKAELSNQ